MADAVVSPRTGTRRRVDVRSSRRRRPPVEPAERAREERLPRSAGTAHTTKGTPLTHDPNPATSAPAPLGDDALGAVSGGLNPQPIPPGFAAAVADGPYSSYVFRRPEPGPPRERLGLLRALEL